MSRIEKLSLQGIRSFGPDEAKRIEFYSPLTLILGQNGCGKTSIIEALKYVTTGEVPPGCGRGALFVHDPKVAKESTVRGQIKLLFHCNRGGKAERIVTSRSLEVTQKAKKLECKTIDCTITRTLANGSKESISHKCVDTQREMCSMLGVSKPILEHVIFCHQEDSNWPLDEGKRVKEKFDSIFNATKYIKCLDNIKKLRVDERKRLNNMNETLDALLSSKEHAARLKRELSELEKDQEGIVGEKVAITEKLTTLRNRLGEIVEIEQNLGAIQVELGGKQMELKSNKTSQDDLRSGQTESFTVSDEELRRMILDFERTAADKQRNLERVNREIERVESSTTSAKNRYAIELQKVGKLEAEHKTHLQNMTNLDKCILDLIASYDIQGFEAKTFEYHEAEEVLGRMKKILQQEEVKIVEKRKDFKMKEDSIQGEIDAQRKKESSMENEIENCTSRLGELSRKSRHARQTLQQNEEELSSENVEELRTSITSVSDEIDAEEKRIDVEKLEAEIRSKKRTLRVIEQDVADVKQKISKLTQQSNARAKHDIFLKEKQELENHIKFLKRKNNQDFEYIFGKNLGENLRNELDCYTRRTQDSREKVKAKLDSTELKKAQLKVKIENDKATISKKEKEISDFEDKLESLCGSQILDAALSRTDEQLEKLMRVEADKTSSTNVMSSYIAKLRENEACPLCYRDFQSREEVDRLIESLEMKLEQLPDHLRQVKANLEANKKRHEDLLQLKPQEKQAGLAKKEVQQLKQGLKKHQEELQKLEDDLENHASSLDIVMSDEATSKRIYSDVIEIDKNYKKINTIKAKLEDISLTLGNSGCEMTMDDLLKQQTDHDNKMQATRDEIEATHNALSQHKDKLQKLRNRKHLLSTRELKFQNKSKEVEKLREDLSQYEKDATLFESQREEAKTKVAPIKFVIKDKLDAKNKMALECQSWIDDANEVIEKMKGKHRRSSDACSSVKRYVLDDGKEKLLQSQNQVATLDAEVKSLDSKKKGLISTANDIKEEMARKKEMKRNLDDEQKIRAKERECQQLETDIKELKSKIRDFNYEKLVKEKDNLLAEERKMTNKKATFEGRLEELQKRRKELNTLLNKREIKDAEKNYKDKLIEKKCIEIATNDLNKYYKALYTAIMRFHSEKMSTINNIIRELWRTTYKGNDIDYIEIKTDESESKGADKRQTYNYRVVMVKSDVEMDMRGRCSAGQKVLASLIIRMALAETFSANCGILALDEPTTNLDKKNIEALALALLNIVNRRSHQRNFQLIVITHDEEFLNKLTKADFIEYYHQVSRDPRGLSTILRKNASRY